VSSWLGTVKRRSIRRRSRPLSAVPGLAPLLRSGWSAWVDLSCPSTLGGGAATATIFIFLFLITVTTLLLMLPIASASGEITPLADALFTAVSAICVTGLTVVNMATHWSPFGHLVVFLGLQIGGIGVMTLATILAVIASKRLGLSVRKMMAGDVDPSRLHDRDGQDSHGMRLSEVKGLLKTVFISVLVIELALAAIIVPRLLVWGLDPVSAALAGRIP
jgi:trk system potassium uptake protein TrkH